MAKLILAKLIKIFTNTGHEIPETHFEDADAM
jgi:hypothetical protein